MLTVNWNCYHYYHHLAIFSRGRLCSSKGAPVPRHNGTMASPILVMLIVASVKHCRKWSHFHSDSHTATAQPISSAGYELLIPRKKGGFDVGMGLANAWSSLCMGILPTQHSTDGGMIILRFSTEIDVYLDKLSNLETRYDGYVPKTRHFKI